MGQDARNTVEPASRTFLNGYAFDNIEVPLKRALGRFVDAEINSGWGGRPARAQRREGHGRTPLTNGEGLSDRCGIGLYFGTARQDST